VYLEHPATRETPRAHWHCTPTHAILEQWCRCEPDGALVAVWSYRIPWAEVVGSEQAEQVALWA